MNSPTANSIFIPENLTKEQAAKALAIRMEIKENYGELDRETENKIVGLAYKLNERYELNPELAPGVEVAYLGSIATLGINLAKREISSAVRIAAGKYLYNIVSPELAKIGVELGLIGDYNQARSEIFEKTKSGDKAKAQAKYNESSGDVAVKMPSPNDLEPDEDKTEWKKGCSKAESPVWKNLQNYKNGVRTNGEKGSKIKFYEWDYLHGEIEVYGPGGRNHLAAICPKTGRIVKGPNAGRNISSKVN